MANTKKKIIDKENMKSFHFKMPKELWILIKNVAMHEDRTMSDLIVACLDKSMKKLSVKIEEK